MRSQYPLRPSRFNGVINCTPAPPVILVVIAAVLAASTPAKESEKAAAPTELADRVASDDGRLVGAIREFILATSMERRFEDMQPYRGTIPLSGVPYEMVAIPGGKFAMGSPADEAHRGVDEGPQRTVAVQPFWMGKFEVTWGQFDPFMSTAVRRSAAGVPEQLPKSANLPDFVSSPTVPYMDMSFGMGRDDDHPAISMTHHAASKFCQWLSAQTGHFYRLPTEAEWEYACRAGSTTAYHFGDRVEELENYGWYWHDLGSDAYAKVGMKKPNPWGLFDMHGNVSEWCLDQYFADAYRGGRRPVPPRDLYPRVYRGGSWDSDPEDLRSAKRFASNKDLKRQDPCLPQSIWYHTDALWLGFRIVRPLEIPSAEEMDRLWNCGDVSEDKPWNEGVRAQRKTPIARGR